MKYELNYAYVDLNGDISKYTYETHKRVFMHVYLLCRNRNGECIWLLGETDNPNVMISSDYRDVLNKVKSDSKVRQWFLFEFDSYQEAYKVALDMAEVHPMCYSPDYNPNTV